MHPPHWTKPVVHFSRGPHRFEVYESQSERGAGYAGYFDGRLSVVATDRHAVTRMLLKRHATKGGRR